MSKNSIYKGNWFNGSRYGQGSLSMLHNGAEELNAIKEQWKSSSDAKDSVSDFDKYFEELAKEGRKELYCIFYNNCPIFIGLDKTFHTDNHLDPWQLKSGCKAVIHYENGDKFSGDIKNFKFNGLGEMKYKNGEHYDGEWKDGLQNGDGTLTRGGTTIKGIFKGGIMESKLDDLQRSNKADSPNQNDFLKPLITEVLLNEDKEEKGRKYEGQVLAGKIKHGKGIQTHADGSQYLGEWRNNKKHGIGMWIDANGNEERGVWENGEHVLKEIDKDCDFTKQHVQLSSG